jgi:hypothetical protein
MSPQINLCQSCRILAVTTCPILDRAYIKGYDGMAQCEMYLVIKKVWIAAQNAQVMGKRREEVTE